MSRLQVLHKKLMMLFSFLTPIPASRVCGLKGVNQQLFPFQNLRSESGMK